MTDEDIVDDISCMQWGDDGIFEDRKRAYLGIIFKNFGSQPVPSLFHLCVHQIHLKAPELVPIISTIRN